MAGNSLNTNNNDCSPMVVIVIWQGRQRMLLRLPCHGSINSNDNTCGGKYNGAVKITSLIKGTNHGRSNKYNNNYNNNK